MCNVSLYISSWDTEIVVTLVGCLSFTVSEFDTRGSFPIHLLREESSSVLALKFNIDVQARFCDIKTSVGANHGPLCNLHQSNVDS